MCRNFVVILLVAVVFFINIQDAFTELTTTQEVESKLSCTSKWQMLKLNWSWKATNLSNKNFNSFWSEHEKDFKNQTVERLQLTVIYPRNFTRTISCCGTVASHVESLNKTWRKNVSIDVQLPSVGSELLGVKLVKQLKVQTRLKFYIRPTSDNNVVSYTLYYCLRRHYLSSALLFQKNYTCPRHSAVEFSCSHRENVVYEIPNSDGIVCEASTKEYVAQVYSYYYFYIQSETRDGSYLASSNFRVFACSSRCAQEGFFTAVLIGQTPSYLTTTTTEQRVVLKWENTGAQRYMITYLCSNGFKSNQTMEDSLTILTIYNKSFAPYSLCTFCVASQYLEGTIFSEPLCNTTRFPERPPGEPPTITCDADTCPTTAHDDERAVTIECRLPQPNTTNGLLKQLVLTYWNDTSHSGAFEKIVTTNLSLCQMTLTNLSKKHEYFAQMSVCNSIGCSSSSDQVLIAKAVVTNLKTARRSEFSKIWPWLLISISITVFFIIAIMLSVSCYRRLNCTQQVPPLPPIEPPPDTDYETNFGQHLNPYVELSKEDDNSNVLDNSC